MGQGIPYIDNNQRIFSSILINHYDPEASSVWRRVHKKEWAQEEIGFQMLNVIALELQGS